MHEFHQYWLKIAWQHFANVTELCRYTKSPKKSIKTPILAFKVIQGHCSAWQSKARVQLPISD